MGMSINVTLLVQMVHFWIAYFVLRKWLWKPAIDLIVGEDNQQVSLEEGLVAQRKIIAHNEHRRERLWYAARQKFLKHIPTIKVASEEIRQESTEMLTFFSEQEERVLVEKVAVNIVTKAEHV